MAQLVKPAPRFTHPEWTYSNNLKYRNAELERQAAERLQLECDRVITATAERTDKSLADVDKKFDQRLDDIQYWKDELTLKQDEAFDEIDKLQALIERISKAQEATKEPVHITQQCLINRQKRQKVDLVHDDVQKELLKEVEINAGVQALLQKTLEQAQEQLRLNRKGQFNLQADLLKKSRAESIDDYCKNLKKSSNDIAYVNSIPQIDSTSVTPEEWQDATNRNIISMEKQMRNSVNLRSVIDGILQQVANDQNQQIKVVNTAFQVRIDETKDAKSKLEEHLALVLAEISKTEDVITNLKKAIEEKREPMQLAQTRFELRKGRESNEKCRDTVEFKLVEEMNELNIDLNTLMARLGNAEASLKGLVRRKLDLEEEIQVKDNSLYIDEVECTTIRKSIKVGTY